MDRLVTELLGASRAATQATERIRTHRNAGTTPDPLDREIVNAWLTAAITLATLSCNWPNAELKAQGARLHHTVSNIEAMT